MTMIVGHLTEQAGRDGEVGYIGEIELPGIGLAGKCCLAPATKRSDASPDFRLLVVQSGRWQDFGGAWRRAPKGGGEEFLSMTADGPLFAARGLGAVNLAAFPPQDDDDDGRWRIVWGRARGGNVLGAAKAAAPLADAIPF